MEYCAIRQRNVDHLSGMEWGDFQDILLERKGEQQREDAMVLWLG